MSESLILNGKEIQFNLIQRKAFPADASPYEKRILEFCSQWLKRQNTFQITTSGSTGQPKTVSIQAELMKLSAEMTIKALGLNKNDNSLVCLNTDFIGGKMMLVRGLIGDMNMFIIDPASNPLKNIPADSKFDFTALVPLQAETILKETPEKKSVLDNMKAILIGGATITTAQEEIFQNIKAPVYHTFGMTETLSHIALRRINGKERQDYFKTMEHVSISTNKNHCLVIESPFSETPLTTKDIVEIIDKDKFRWLGRKDFVINSGGIKVYPEKVEKEIEKIFYDKNIDKRFFIAGIPDSTLGESVALFIEGNNKEGQWIENIKERLSKVLLKYEIPKRFFFCDKFKETGSGKIDRVSTIKHLVL